MTLVKPNIRDLRSSQSSQRHEFHVRLIVWFTFIAQSKLCVIFRKERWKKKKKTNVFSITARHSKGKQSYFLRNSNNHFLEMDSRVI